MQVITVCGVFSGNGDLESVDHVAMVVGAKDPVAAFGRIAYPGRSPFPIGTAGSPMAACIASTFRR